MQPKFASLEVEYQTSRFLNAFLTAARDVVDLELVLDKYSLPSQDLTHKLSETSPSDLVCPRLQNLRLIYKGTEPKNLVSMSNEIVRHRNNCPHMASLESLKFKVIGDVPNFEFHHGLGQFNDLWERGLKDGSDTVWENERKKLLSRPGWINILEGN